MNRPRTLPDKGSGTILALLLGAVLLAGCARTPAPRTQRQAPSGRIAAFAVNNPSASLQRMGYAIQVGAFSRIDNAVRLERLLIGRGIEAFHFRHESGLYKVRFGNHASYQAARTEAEQLQAQKLIDTFFIVRPEDYAVARLQGGMSGTLREELVRTARGFLGVPYRWGGVDGEDGFDCSGLAMACYRLNGLHLPRVSRHQYESGRSVGREELSPGDLVFFATEGGERVSHVGIYIGDGRFIHAARTGQQVRIDQMTHPFYEKTFRGGRSYF